MQMNHTMLEESPSKLSQESKSESNVADLMHNQHFQSEVVFYGISKSPAIKIVTSEFDDEYLSEEKGVTNRISTHHKLMNTS